MRRLARFVALVVAIGLVAPLLAQPGRMGNRGGISVAMLLGQKSVQEEIKMSDDQIAKVKDVNEKIRSKYADELKGSFKDREKAAELFKKIGEETTKALADVVKPEQMKRVKQIELQLGGLSVLTREDVSKALNLTEKQISDAKAMADDLSKDRQEIMKEAGFKDKEKMTEAREKVAKLSKEVTAKFIAKLTDDQKKTYKELTGDEFKGKIETPMGRRPQNDKE